MQLSIIKSSTSCIFYCYSLRVYVYSHLMIFACLFHVRNSFFLFFIIQDCLVEILWLPSIVGQKISVYFRYQFRFIDLIKIEFLRSPQVRSRANRWVWWWDSKEGGGGGIDLLMIIMTKRGWRPFFNFRKGGNLSLWVG